MNAVSLSRFDFIFLAEVTDVRDIFCAGTVNPVELAWGRKQFWYKKDPEAFSTVDRGEILFKNNSPAGAKSPLGEVSSFALCRV